MCSADSDLRELTELSRRNRRSRASLIREAVATFLALHKRGSEGDAFGLWGTKRPDGLAYQKKLRAEW
jgi:hypothetical protein